MLIMIRQLHDSIPGVDCDAFGVDDDWVLALHGEEDHDPGENIFDSSGIRDDNDIRVDS